MKIVNPAGYDKYDVNYMEAQGKKRCGNCAFYTDGNCGPVEGRIDPDHVCGEWMRGVDAGRIK